MVRFGKPDSASKAIDAWMRARGASIMKLDSLGDGWPDRCYGIRGVNVLAEIKTGRKKCRTNQTERAQEWRGSPIWMWRTPEDAQATLREAYGLSV